MIDHLDILKDGASAVYGADAIAGVVNFFLVHKFRGLEIGGTYGNTNLGASNEMGEWEAWIKAGTGDEKTDIVVIADFWERTGGLFSADRDISRNAGQQVFWGGFDGRSSNIPGSVSASGSPFSSANFRLIPSLFFSANSPPPHSAPNKETSPFYLNSVAVRFPQPVGTNTAPGLDGNYFRFNFAAFTPALPPADRQSFYGSFTRDICDKYLTIFGDFKYVRSFFDANPATAFNPFLGFAGHNTAAARSAVYVTLHNSGEYELPLGYATINGDLFKLPAGPVSFALGGEYDGPRFTRDRDVLNNTFSSIGSVDGQSFKVNRDVWSIYEEVRVPFTSPTWNFPGFYSFEVDFAEREEWYSNNTSSVPGIVKIPAQHSQYNAQKPKISIRWEPLDPKWIGALTLRGSYTEAFHAPNLSEIAPAGSQNFPGVVDPFSSQTDIQVEEHISGNPQLHPEVAYEWTYGAVYSPKWIKGLTLSADWWHIDMRDIVSALGAQFVIEHFTGTDLVLRGPSTVPGELGPVNRVIDPSQNLAGAIFEGLDYEAIYILDSSIFGHGDFGRVTTTVNGTWLSRAELQTGPDTKMFGIAGEFLPTAFSLTSSLPRNRANGSLFYDGPADSWAQGFDIGVVVHWISQYEDDNISFTGGKPQTPRTNPPGTTNKLGEDVSGLDAGGPRGSAAPGGAARKVAAWTTFDLIASYTFNLPPPAPAPVPGFAKDGGKNFHIKDGKEKNVMPVSTAEYHPCGWGAWLNNTTISIGMQNVFDEDPPFAAGAGGYDASIATIKGRCSYVQLNT